MSRGRAGGVQALTRSRRKDLGTSLGGERRLKQGQQHEREPASRVPVPPHLKAPEAAQPRQRPLHSPAMPTSRVDGSIPRRAIRGRIPRRRREARFAALSSPLSARTVPGRVRRRPAGVRTAGTSSRTASNVLVSLTLAAVSGSPPPSQTRWSLLPGLPRSTGFAPTWSPTLGAHAHGVHAGPRPVQLAVLAQPVEDLEVELLEHPGTGPLGKAAPARRRRAAAQLPGGQQPPWGRGTGHEHDRAPLIAPTIQSGAVAMIQHSRRARA